MTHGIVYAPVPLTLRDLLGRFVLQHWIAVTMGVAGSALIAALHVLTALSVAGIVELVTKGGEVIALAAPVAKDGPSLNHVGRFVLNWLFTRTRSSVLDLDPVIAVCSFAVLVSVAAAGSTVAVRMHWHRVRLQFVRSTQVDFYVHLHRLPFSYLNQQKSAELATRLHSNVSAMSGPLVNLLSEAITAALSLVVYLYLLLSTSASLTVLSLGIGLVYVLSSHAVGSLTRKLVSARFRSFEHLAGTAQEAISATRVVKTYCAERWEASRFSEVVSEFIGAELKSLLFSREVPQALSMLLTGLAIASVAAVGIVQLREGQLTQQGLAMFVVVSGVMFSSANKLAQATLAAFRASAAGKDVFDMWHLLPEEEDRDGEPLDFGQVVRLEGVWFSYPGADDAALKGIDLEIRKGEVLGVVGSSGGGKSTLVDLLLRLHEPQQGRILIDGVDVGEQPLHSYRRLFAVVPQEPLLFNDTVRRNIGYGCATEESDIVWAATVANAHEFISKFPGGYDTLVGERGSRLSGGQRQRIAIARALARRPQVLVLDEATSALDSVSERLVQVAISQAVSSRTAVIVAHRLSTLRDADRIIVVGGGRVIEQGTHDELIAAHGSYYDLYQQQAGESEPGVGAA